MQGFRSSHYASRSLGAWRVMVMGMLFTQPNAMNDKVQLEPRRMMDD
jgi:hypothetical protein